MSADQPLPYPLNGIVQNVKLTEYTSLTKNRVKTNINLLLKYGFVFQWHYSIDALLAASPQLFTANIKGLKEIN